MNLFCFPFAGGSSSIYSNWNSYFGSSINVIPFELSGRGRRIVDSYYDSIDEAIMDIISKIQGQIEHSEYCLFGHSMGAIIVYRLLHFIETNNLKKPEFVFISGTHPPHIKKEKREIYKLPDNEFIEVLKGYGGTPREFFKNQELIEFFLPILRSDFKIASFGFDGIDKIDKLDSDINILYGTYEENFTRDDAKDWALYTNGKCNFYEINGDHFFINKNYEEVISIIKEVTESKILT